MQEDSKAVALYNEMTFFFPLLGLDETCRKASIIKAKGNSPKILFP